MSVLVTQTALSMQRHGSIIQLYDSSHFYRYIDSTETKLQKEKKKKTSLKSIKKVQQILRKYRHATPSNLAYRSRLYR